MIDQADGSELAREPRYWFGEVAPGWQLWLDGPRLIEVGIQTNGSLEGAEHDLLAGAWLMKNLADAVGYSTRMVAHWCADGGLFELERGWILAVTVRLYRRKDVGIWGLSAVDWADEGEYLEVFDDYGNLELVL
jgi:hypothetical protein